MPRSSRRWPLVIALLILADILAAPAILYGWIAGILKLAFDYQLFGVRIDQSWWLFATGGLAVVLIGAAVIARGMPGSGPTELATDVTAPDLAGSAR